MTIGKAHLDSLSSKFHHYYYSKQLRSMMFFHKELVIGTFEALDFFLRKHLNHFQNLKEFSHIAMVITIHTSFFMEYLILPIRD